MNRLERLFIGSIVALTALHQGAAAADVTQCSAVLQPALKTLITSGKLQSSTDTYTAWQCSQEFKTHNDAIKAGFSVGFPVYGVPVQVGGNFDKTQVDTWKNENCSSSARATSADAATSYFLSELAPGVVPGWNKCIHDLGGSQAVECDFEAASPYVFTARWHRTAGELPSATPKVTRFTVVNGSCAPVLEAGKTTIGEGGEGTSCTPTQRQAISVLLNTDRGFCSASTQSSETITKLSGVMTLDADKSIQADIVEVEPNSKIITNGHYLGIEANELRLTGDSQIISFVRNRPNRPGGDPGRSGGSIIVQSRLVTGNRLAIDVHGEDGAVGATGEPGAIGSPGTPGARGAQGGTRGCVGRVSAGKGGTGGTGGTGGQGGAAGNGGDVVIRVGSGLTDGALTRIAVITSPDGKTKPGAPGGPGAPGAKGPGGPGGAPSGGGHWCGGVPTGPAGEEGKLGKPGKPGTGGIGGSVHIETNVAVNG